MDTIYLDNAATAQRPSCVLVAVQEFYEQKNANPLRGFYPLSLEATESYQEARKTVQEFIHAEEPEEIIFTRNTTESLNLVAYSYGLNFLKEGDEIAVTIMEHHSNLLPWQMVSRMTGAKLHYLECTSEGELTDEELQKGINERTRLVAVAQVSNVLGCVLRRVGRGAGHGCGGRHDQFGPLIHGIGQAYRPALGSRQFHLLDTSDLHHETFGGPGVERLHALGRRDDPAEEIAHDRNTQFLAAEQPDIAVWKQAYIRKR